MLPTTPAAAKPHRQPIIYPATAGPAGVNANGQTFILYPESSSSVPAAGHIHHHHHQLHHFPPPAAPPSHQLAMLRPTMPMNPAWMPYQQALPTPDHNHHHNHDHHQEDPKSSPHRSQWYPDVYSKSFISDHERSINIYPASTVRAQPPPRVDFARFVENFAGKGFLSQWVPAVMPMEMATNAVAVNSRPSGSGGDKRAGKNKRISIRSPATGMEIAIGPFALDSESYGAHFLKLLAEEIAADDTISKSYNLYNATIIPQDPSQFLFQLQLPGLRENTPMVQLGDLIKLRQVKPGMPGYYPVFTGYEHETYVYGIDKTVGYVVLRADGLWLEPGGKFNVIFGVQEQRWEGCKRAIANIGNSLPIPGQKKTEDGTDTAERPYLKRMLFPEKSDGKMQHTLTRGVFETHWIDRELNYEQHKAVDSILRQDYGSVPFIISGPPGTGKTKTIVEAVLQLIYAPRTPRHHILLCAPSQEAADTLALRLAQHLDPTVLFRLQSNTRTFSEVPIRLMTYTHIENDMFSIPEWKKLMRFRVVVCSCRDADILVQARCTNRDLGRWEKSVVDSLRGVAEDSPDFVEVGESVRLHWSALLVDEAAQGMEPEIVIPLSVVAPPEEASSDKPIVVMVGDQRQLGPITVKDGELRISAFERLFARPIYSEHPWRRELYSTFGGIKGRSEEVTADLRAKMLPCLYPAFTNLVRNYRSHAAILAVPSAFFYNDTLIPEATDSSALEGWTGWKGSPVMPVKLILNSGLDESHEEAISFYNLREIKLAVETVQSLLSPDFWPEDENGKNTVPITPHQIAVMSPFREQVKRLRKAFRAADLNKVNVGPVEAYQGAEYRFVIICTTRARERFLKNDREKGAGLIFEERRANVALTRAKQGLVVIGNPWILERDSIWREWMSFAWRHDAVDFDSEEDFSPRAKHKEKVFTPDLSASPASSSATSACATPKTYASVQSAGKSKPVNAWRPRGDVESTGLFSRLETALVFRSKARDGAVFGFNSGWDEDDPMFLAGIAAEEEVTRQIEINGW